MSHLKRAVFIFEEDDAVLTDAKPHYPVPS